MKRDRLYKRRLFTCENRIRRRRMDIGGTISQIAWKDHRMTEDGSVKVSPESTLA